MPSPASGRGPSPVYGRGKLADLNYWRERGAAEPHKKAEKIVPASSLNPDKIHCWPHLVRIEFIIGLISLILITLWSIVIDAPLEEAANATRTPNPSKAPWYFLGLQEMLVYFDPWVAGVVLPSLIIVG